MTFPSAGTVNLAGRRFGKAVALRIDSHSKRDGCYWRLLCECGEEFTARADNLRFVTERYGCPTCSPRYGSRLRTCRVCGARGHNSATCPDRVVRYQPGAGTRCLTCAGLPHRRDADGCRGCGAPYEPEPPVTLSEVMDRGRGESRVFPEGVGFK